MPAFPSNPFRPCTASADTLADRIGTTYRRHLARHPFLLFGLPFISIMVLSSFLLTPATALRYEKHDRQNREVSQSEAMNMGLSKMSGLGETVEEGGGGMVKYNPRKRKMLDPKQGSTERDEYYVTGSLLSLGADADDAQRLMAKDLDDWEQKRVERWKGEPDGRL